MIQIMRVHLNGYQCVKQADGSLKDFDVLNVEGIPNMMNIIMNLIYVQLIVLLAALKCLHLLQRERAIML